MKLVARFSSIGVLLACVTLFSCGKKSSGQLDWDAFEKGDLSSIEEYLAAGGDPEIRHSGPTGWKLMHFAARWGQTGPMEQLVAKNAKIDATTADGWTPLFFAALNGHAEAARYLLGKGANVNARATDGSTPLDVVDGDEVEQVLIQAGGKKSQ